MTVGREGELQLDRCCRLVLFLEPWWREAETPRTLQSLAGHGDDLLAAGRPGGAGHTQARRLRRSRCDTMLSSTG